MIEKKRLDVLIFEKGLSESREKAKLLIMSGLVYVDNQKSDKPGTIYREDVNIEVRGKTNPYVSRGGLKLEKAIKTFDINVKDKICMDIGASTGGFTDCMLQNGAKKVYSIDVGYGQLAWKLRTDARVVNVERTNIRYMTKEQIKDQIDFFSIDVSFISLKIVLPVVRELVIDGATAVCLIKPQFEAGRDEVGKKGVVKDKKTHIKVINEICNFTLSNGYSILGLSFSPIKGPEGNIEYLIYLKKDNESKPRHDINIDNLVEESHLALSGGK